jgi:peptidoglycan/LPS O-acetylase OafA/YrhL
MHYFTLNSTDWIEADIVAIAAVEVFFVLSGFVLAPQIPTMVTSAVVGVGLVVAISIARLTFGDFAQWDAEVRRVVVFRIDSIVFGFLLYIAIAKLEKDVRLSIRLALPILIMCSVAVGAVTYLTTKMQVIQRSS